jgi:hypothetical protein
VTCDLDFDRWDEAVHNVYLFENRDTARTWRKQTIAPNSYPSHQLRLADVNRDGKWDIISQAAGYKVVTYYENTGSREGGAFRRGDANADGVVDLSDAIVLLLYLFGARAELACDQSADMNDSGALDLADVVYCVYYLFAGGSAPPLPFHQCGVSEAAVALSCDTYPPCGS